MAKLEPTMFREYDLRGRVNDSELNEHSVRIIAKAYGSMLRQRGIKDAVVGHDLRTGSKELTEYAVQALMTTGVNVIFLGQILTPMMYSAQYYYNTMGGVMVTASHNPNGWLGFKLALGLSYTFGPKEIEELKKLTITEEFTEGEGTLREENYLPLYSKDVVSRIKLNKPVKVLINAGNGTAGPIVPAILRKAGCEVVEFLTEPDLKFTHYFPNPALEEMMHDTGQQTVKNHADLGVAIDGDGDRLGITDELGQVVWPDRYTILLSRAVLQSLPNSSIVFDFKSSRALAEDIKAHGGKPVIWKTGHSYIKEKLNELNAPVACEMSGHVFFGKPYYYGFDDAVFAALKMAELLSNSNKSFSALIEGTPSYVSTPSLQAQCKDEIKYEVVEAIIKSFIAEKYEVFTFDNNPRLGGRVEFVYGWGVVRASSNLPVLTLRFEAIDQSKLDEIVELFRNRLSKYPEVSKKWESG